jgi:hypothetical protein
MIWKQKHIISNAHNIKDWTIDLIEVLISSCGTIPIEVSTAENKSTNLHHFKAITNQIHLTLEAYSKGA